MTAPGVLARPRAAVRRRRSLAPLLAVVAWAALIAAAVLWAHLGTPPKHLQLKTAAPFYGTHRLLKWQLWPATVAAVALLVAARFARRVPWRPLLLLGWFAAAGWALLLASSDGWKVFGAHVNAPNEYRGALPAITHDPLQFVRTFTHTLYRYPVQVRGHPPLPPMLLWALERLGLHGPTWGAAFLIAVGSSSVVAVALTLRAVTSVDVARRAIPWLVVAPGTTWVATSMDAAFLGVCAWAAAGLALAACCRRRLVAATAALPAGVLLGAIPYLSYGLLPFGAIAVAVVVLARRRTGNSAWPVATGAVLGAASVAVAFTVAGFWWPAGVRATHHWYAHHTGSGSRPYGYFLLADLAVFAVMVGPATAVALVRVVRRLPVVAWLVAAALLAVVVSDLSGFMRGEVERIWLPYGPWVAIAATCLPIRTRWLAPQLLTALCVQAFVASPW